ncbi:YmdB family metallophosphoesterase [bacterium]|nr:YmdB family metallophosphoesterase [bacterium]
MTSIVVDGLTVAVEALTRFEGTLAAGSSVEVKGILRAGVLLAGKIEADDEGEDEAEQVRRRSTIKIVGLIESIATTTEGIVGIRVNGVEVVIESSTELEAGLRVGDTVNVRAVPVDGALVATKIDAKKSKPARPARSAFKLAGVVESIDRDDKGNIVGVVVNAENASGGFGATAENALDILESGADVITLGDHMLDHRSITALLEDPRQPVLRPANYPVDGLPGRGVWTGEVAGVKVRLIVLQGRVFMREGPDNPFVAADTLLAAADPDEVVLVEFHAEATSEKHAMFWHLDGRAAAAWGTHTHVPTADERLYPQGLGAISDLGMTGALDSIIGFDPKTGLERFRTGMVQRLRPPRFGPGAVRGALFTIDPARRAAVAVSRVRADEMYSP